MAAMKLMHLGLTVHVAGEVTAPAIAHVDIIELGTPLIKQQGLSGVTNVKAAHPEKLIFADMKTMDAGELEADLAFRAGADIMTVLGSAGDSTMRARWRPVRRTARPWSLT